MHCSTGQLDWSAKNGWDMEHIQSDLRPPNCGSRSRSHEASGQLLCALPHQASHRIWCPFFASQLGSSFCTGSFARPLEIHNLEADFSLPPLLWLPNQQPFCTFAAIGLVKPGCHSLGSLEIVLRLADHPVPLDSSQALWLIWPHRWASCSQTRPALTAAAAGLCALGGLWALNSKCDLCSSACSAVDGSQTLC